MTNKEAVRLLVDTLVESPLSDDEIDGVVDRSMDMIIYGASADRAGGALQLRMCAEIAKRRDAAVHGRQPDPATPSTEPAAAEPTAAALSSEALRILDEMRNRFAYDMSSDSRIAEVERWDARLREILFVLGKAP